MKYSEQPLQTFRLRNFKAVRDSGVVKFSPLTVFIGNNGSGKSSLIEGLETFQSIVVDGLDEAMNRWRGFENVLNKSVFHKALYPEGQRPCLTKPMEFEIIGRLTKHGSKRSDYFRRVEMRINASPTYDDIFIQFEKLRYYLPEPEIIKGYGTQTRNSLGQVENVGKGGVKIRLPNCSMGKSQLRVGEPVATHDWQFLNLDPEKMGEPKPQKRTGDTVKLARDGSNIGDYLWDLIQQPDGPTIFEGIIETLRYVLPYAKDIQPTLTTQLQRTIYLQLSEERFHVPGWLLSTGTLRVLALLAVLRHPDPPPLLFIEEIENGLDPRTLNLLVDEIQRVTQSGVMQVICTTHSPYFLDLLPLSSLVVVERDESGQPTFTRPDEQAMGDWAKEFAPGQLYTMSQLTKN